MPALETMDCKERVTLWTFSGETDIHGQRLVNDPVEVRVRWVDTRTDPLAPQQGFVPGDVRISIGRNVPIGSLFCRVPLEDVLGTGTADYFEDGGLMELKSLVKANDLKERHTRWEGTLMRYKGSLPVSGGE